MRLNQLNKQQWEDLCDKCGRCCLHKLETSSGEIHFSDVACQYLDNESCTCTRYKQRKALVSNCLSIEKNWLDTPYKFNWLPKTCAYRLIYEGKDLPVWHHQISGNKNSVHFAGISIRGRHYSDKHIKEKDFNKHIID